MKYSVLILGPVAEIFLEDCRIDFNPEASDFRGYDLVADLKTGLIHIPPTGESVPFPERDYRQVLAENLKALAAREYDEKTTLEMLAGSRELFENAKRLYLREYRDLTPRLESLYSRREYLKLRELIHKVKGYALYVGGNLLTEVAERLEAELTDGKSDYYHHFIRLHERLLKRIQVENV